MLLPYQNIQADNPAYNPWIWFNIIGEMGCLLWIIAYVLIFFKAKQDRTYGLPLIAICLNFAWEALAAFILPNPVDLWQWFARIWFGLDLFLVWQLIKYGREEMDIPEVRQHFLKIVASIFIASIVAEYTFVMTYFDRLGIVTAFFSNLVMSALFIPFFFARRHDRRGLSLPAAWCKMLGTLCISIACYYLVPAIDPELPTVAFLVFSCSGVFLLDCIYIALLMFVKPASEEALEAIATAEATQTYLA
ncbi:MAG: hypothetical protein QNJ46_30480 [Leptolyngbyaceae cyanobacterium MO_188.B28]|nr:hypothetical protein [Leptolyngbyaceae cyanobacterium MO_188.B28]